MNRDGHLDLIERIDTQPDGESREAIIWLGHSDGTFEASTRHSVELVGYANAENFNPNHDFDEDGLADLALPNADHTRILIRPGLPSGGWGAATDSVSGDPLISLMAVGDLNGDGHLDLVGSRYSDFKKDDRPLQMVQVLGHGDGTFSGPRALAMEYSGPLSLLDWNGDGILDILSDGEVLHIMYGKGDGRFAEDQTCAAGGAFGYGITQFLDLNHDGRFDMLWIPQSTKRLATAFGQGGCNFTPRTDYSFSHEPVGFVMGDLDGDGVPDVLVGGRFVDPSSFPLNNRYLTTTAFLTGRADGTFVRQPDLEIPWPLYGDSTDPECHPIITDVNTDGRADIVTAGRAGIEVYANTCAH